MAKQGQHKHDSHDQRKSKGPNKASNQTIITGTYKKPETYREQAFAHEDTDPLPQAARDEWSEDTRDKPSIEDSTRARQVRSGRSGSDSNAGPSTSGG